jgi:hypothetical protein
VHNLQGAAQVIRPTAAGYRGVCVNGQGAMQVIGLADSRSGVRLLYECFGQAG